MLGGWAREAGKGGGDGSSVGNKACTGSTFWAPLKTNNWSDLAGDEGGRRGGGGPGRRIGLIWLVTRGGGVGGVGQGGGQGGRWGGAPKSSLGATRRSFRLP